MLRVSLLKNTAVWKHVSCSQTIDLFLMFSVKASFSESMNIVVVEKWKTSLFASWMCFLGFYGI